MPHGPESAYPRRANDSELRCRASRDCGQIASHLADGLAGAHMPMHPAPLPLLHSSCPRIGISPIQSCATTFEVVSTVVSHAWLRQTLVDGPPWRFSLTAGPAKCGRGPNKRVVLLEGLKSIRIRQSGFCWSVAEVVLLKGCFGGEDPLYIHERSLYILLENLSEIIYFHLFPEPAPSDALLPLQSFLNLFRQI